MAYIPDEIKILDMEIHNLEETFKIIDTETKRKYIRKRTMKKAIENLINSIESLKDLSEDITTEASY